jgi:glycosyltransferase involved in cell wall biosynthesis
MKILLYAGDFAGAGRTDWLLDDLAAALATRGHEVDVVVFDTKASRRPGRRPSPTGLFDIISVGPTNRRPGLVGKALAFLGTARRIRAHGRSVPSGTYDLALYTSVAMFSWGAPGLVRRRGAARRLGLILWDFFPVHNVEIGRIRQSPLVPLLRACEVRAIRSADKIAVMSPANERFLRSYFPEVDAPVDIVPPWASADAPTERDENDVFTIVFGGQLVAGRGVDTLLRSISVLGERRSDFQLIVAGDGPERRRLESLVDGLGTSNVTFTGALPRPEYREVLSRADLGIAITVPGVSPPSFPSKIVEYCAAGVPVVVCVEPSSDAHHLLERAGAGRGASAGDVAGVAEAIQAFYEEWAEGRSGAGRAAARRLFDEEFSLERAVTKIEGL